MSAEKDGPAGAASAAGPASDALAPDDAVWTYRGYRMKPSEFNTAWVHYYRAEIQRSNTWRTRLDALDRGAALSLL